VLCDTRSGWGTAPARAQEQTPEGSTQAQAAAPVDLTFARFFLQDPTNNTAWWDSHTVVDGPAVFTWPSTTRPLSTMLTAPQTAAIL